MPFVESSLKAMNIHASVQQLRAISLIYNLIAYRFRGIRYKLIVTSSPETNMKLSWIFIFLILLIYRVETLCIRNSIRWRFSSRIKESRSFWKVDDNLYTLFKKCVSTILSSASEHSLLYRSNSLVFESSSQRDSFFAQHPNLSTKPHLIFSGRLPLSDYPGISQVKKSKELNSIVVGILGSICPKRREYKTLLEALINLKNTGFYPSVVFLGRQVSPESGQIINLFSPFLGNSKTRVMEFVDETTIINAVSALDVLIAPLNPTWGYEIGWSTGAIGDSEFMNLPLLLPEFVRSVYLEDSINFYGNSEELATKLSGLDVLKLPNASLFSKDKLCQFLLADK